MGQSRWAAWAALALLLAGGARVMATYGERAQGFDEPGHIAAGMGWLAKGTYLVDPLHPPLGRDAIALPLYLAGERYPKLTANDPASANYNVIGNAVLYGDGHLRRNLALARFGVLPFFFIAGLVVFAWSRREFGDLAAVLGVALFSTLPMVLAMAGMAYTDIVAAAMQALCLFAFASWIERPTARRTLLTGIAAGLALLAKFTTLLFVPAAVAAMAICKWAVSRGQKASYPLPVQWIGKLAAIAVLAVGVTWAGYGFSVGHVQEDMQLTPAAMPSFQHFPGPVRTIARDMVMHDSVVPAPALLRGIASAWALNKTPAQSYLLGRIKTGGWWYFFLLGIAVKSPIPFVLLSLVGLWAATKRAGEGRWQALAPAVCALAILIVTMPTKYNAGVRHVLPVFPLLAIVAGAGCDCLWNARWRGVRAGAAVLGALLLWQAISSLQAQNDFLAYFNALAGSDPSLVLVLGCDLDCGQDLYRLSAVLQSKHISEVKLAVWSSAELSQMGLPQFEMLPPDEPTNGWIAVSMRSLRFGDVLHQSYPHDGFAWLNRYRPEEEIGRTIRLYHITDVPAEGH